jgi:ATP-dependent metalloprotease
MVGGSISTNLLAHMEQTANNNPSSATAQNAFYTALLRAEMPVIVVQRYQTGRYATSPAVDSTYQRALERIGQMGTSLGPNALPKTPSNLTSEQLQAIGQAIAASSQGGHIGVVRGKNGQASTGAKESPLYVVVEESIGSSLFKWARFFLYFGFVAWLVSMIFTFAVETTGAIKKVSGTQNNEAQPQHQTVRFSDVHGCDEAKEELQELVEFLKAPENFSSLGGKLPKGVLLVGPPGTGKTLLARAVAGESGVPFFFMSGAEFDEIYVGVGAKRVRDLFSNARAKAPAIIFIDELDAIGGKRNERDPAYVKQSLNQLLTELDGFSQETGVVIIAATNFPQLLDQALTRPGRFDRHVIVPLPDVRGRVEILDHHMKNIQIAPEVDSTIIARGTPGFSGAELENLVNQAAVHASRNKSKNVGPADLEWAKDKIIMGAERRSAVIQEKDKIMTAYHEGGHALVALYNPNAFPLYKATIMPRGQSLGMTTMLPEMDMVSQAKKQYLAQIDVSMGGKVAEEIVYGSDSVSSGCAAVISPILNNCVVC